MGAQRSSDRPSSSSTPQYNGKDNPEDPEGSEGSTVKGSNSTDGAPTENSGITTNSSEKLFQNEQKGTRVDTDFTQEERDNMTAYPIKPSGPSEPSASASQQLLFQSNGSSMTLQIHHINLYLNIR